MLALVAFQVALVLEVLVGLVVDLIKTWLVLVKWIVPALYHQEHQVCHHHCFVCLVMYPWEYHYYYIILAFFPSFAGNRSGVDMSKLLLFCECLVR